MKEYGRVLLAAGYNGVAIGNAITLSGCWVLV